MTNGNAARTRSRFRGAPSRGPMIRSPATRRLVTSRVSRFRLILTASLMPLRRSHSA